MTAYRSGGRPESLAHAPRKTPHAGLPGRRGRDAQRWRTGGADYVGRSDQATRTELRNLSTSVLSRPLSPASERAAVSTCEEAEPVSLAPRCTSVMLEDTCWVPCAACWTLREISCVAAPCSSTAEAIVAEISDSRSMVLLISLIAPTDSCVAAWMLEICCPISPVALAVCSASALTSEATTAKPRPASPARAASMVAFKAKRLV